ncbi:MAG: hypothetical protein HY020_23145 [Burkholderiales bacterium]|nr:hypothetical protein [Burkholderiales bacterium]
MISSVQTQRRRIAGLAAAFLTGCAISTPQRVAPLAPDEPADALVYVSITQARVRPESRAEFAELTRRVAALLDQGQPGLVCHSIRREVLGSQAWTLTVWRSPAAREQFARHPIHAEAMAVSRRLLAEVRVRRLELRREELPLGWDKALALLDAAPAGG